MEKDKKNKLIVLVSGIVVILLMVAGISFAIFRFGETSTNQELVLGDIWMKYTESNGISLENALPGDEYTNYFEFTITGTNTYTKKDIYYDISLTHGDTPAGKTEDNRVEDKYLKFKLTEVNNGTETEIFTDKTYDDLSNKRVHVDTISKSTNEYSKTYRLYMVISEELTYGNSSDAILSTEEFGKIFGSIKVNVTGDFDEKELPLTPSETILKAAINKESSDSSCKTYVEEDGITYISGSKECIDFNYVWYSGKLWRITAIYPDGTMKMITDSAITIINWGSNSTVSSEDLTSAYSTSWIREWLNQEFLPTLYNYENIIVEDAGWYSITDSASTPTKPTGDYTLTDPVGLLNSYEYYKSYQNASDSNGYLNIGYDWWLMTPYNSSYVRYVSKYGSINSQNPSSNGIGVRPSINLKSVIQLSGGTGTIDDPYRINSVLEEITANATLLNTRYSGEYVKLEDDESNRLFRIVDKELVGESLTTKLVLNDYVKESDSILTKKFSSSESHELWSEADSTDTTYWRGYLNTTWLQTLNTSMLEKGTYYLGHTSGSYKTTVCSTVSSDVSIKGCIENGTIVSNISSDDYVGLLRVGEMFASLTSDYTYSNVKAMWLITTVSTSISIVRIIHYDGGYLSSSYPSKSSIAVRPTIHLKDTIVIKSGSGTKQDPFVVGLPN